MTLQEIKAYKTTDGTVFEDEQAAQQHQARLQLRALVAERGYRGMDTDDIADMLVDHAKDIAGLLAKLAR